MELATLQDLLCAEGSALLGEVEQRLDAEGALALGSRLRERHPPERVSGAIGTVELRRRARRKFGTDADVMFFTRDALEQATRATVTEHRARQLLSLGVTEVVDLGCGIGGDLIGCARVGISAHGVELDPVRAAMAAANLAALDLAGSVTCGDATTTEIAPEATAFIDPARRDGRGRVFSTAGLVPPWSVVTKLLTGQAVAKVMPGIRHEEIPAEVEAEWVSDGGDLVEACLWGAAFGRTGRRATVLPAGASLTSRDTVATTGPVDAWLLEPDDAVIRAGLVAELAEDLGGQLIDSHIAWITCPEPSPTPFGRWFRVIEELPFHEKQLRAALRERDVGTLTIKKRGVDTEPERLIKRLKLTGHQTTTLVMTRAAGRGTTLAVEPQ